eukprot:5559881-Pyramimonas_sp.AAC.1
MRWPKVSCVGAAERFKVSLHISSLTNVQAPNDDAENTAAYYLEVIWKGPKGLSFRRRLRACTAQQPIVHSQGGEYISSADDKPRTQWGSEVVWDERFEREVELTVKGHARFDAWEVSLVVKKAQGSGVLESSSWWSMHSKGTATLNLADFVPPVYAPGEAKECAIPLSVRKGESSLLHLKVAVHRVDEMYQPTGDVLDGNPLFPKHAEYGKTLREQHQPAGHNEEGDAHTNPSTSALMRGCNMLSPTRLYQSVVGQNKFVDYATWQNVEFSEVPSQSASDGEDATRDLHPASDPRSRSRPASKGMLAHQ